MSALRRVIGTGAIGAGVVVAALTASNVAEARDLAPAVIPVHARMPSRSDQVSMIQAGTASNPFDVLIIGGGATGTGCAVDAATRGLRTAMVEQEDFGAGTSSRSTKLVHGGVRYLEKAVFGLDYGQLKLVFEALHERKRLLENAPHLTTALPIMTPCYKWWEVPFYWAGLKMYDLVAGTQGLTLSRYVTPGEARRQFPTLSPTREDGATLKGTIVYYDGQFDDARLNVALACTAAGAGAAVLNHAKVMRLLKDDKDTVIGAEVQDQLSGKSIKVHARAVINATGCFADSIRKLSEPGAAPMIMPSSGVHITLPDYYSPEHLGMIVPKTKDGRVVFMLPWMEATIAGTTDSSTDITMAPQPTEAEIQFILDAISDYLTVKVRRSDVRSAWSGIRPLALDPSAKGNTSNALRDHIVHVSEDNLITVTGGKWTTYRLMAQDAIDAAVKNAGLSTAQPCSTTGLRLVGGHGFNDALFTEVAQSYVVPHRPGAIDTRVAKHLASAYGDRAHEVTRIAEEQKLGHRLARGHPQLEAEVVYTARHEYCESAQDFLARRTRLAFLDIEAAREALPRVVELLAAEKGWGRWRKSTEQKQAMEFLDTFYAAAAPPALPTELTV